MGASERSAGLDWKRKWTQISRKVSVILTTFNLPKPCLYCSSFPIATHCGCLQEEEGCSPHSSSLETVESVKISTCSIIYSPTTSTRPISQLEIFISVSSQKPFTVPCHWGQSNTVSEVASAAWALQPQSCGVRSSIIELTRKKW